MIEDIPLFVVSVVDMVEQGVASVDTGRTILTTAILPEVGIDAPRETVARVSRHMDNLLQSICWRPDQRALVLESLTWTFERAAAKDFSALAAL